VKTIVWQGPERMAVEERPEPDAPAPGDVVLRPGAVGICGSEVEGYLGHMGNRTPPLVMGHEFAGEVVAAGEGAEGWVGKRVTVNPIESCGHCRHCLAGDENLCAERTLIGVHHDGAFADLVRAGGRMVCIGLAADETTLGFHGVVRGQVDIQGSYAYTMADFDQSLAWLAEGRATLGELPPVLPLEEGPEAFARLVERPPDQVKVFLAGEGRET
jgi:threonine dehydrogenase-like Zn-dependent dehydrogenase